jgi:predicted DNA-binding transcriptional regulator YafY
VTTTPSLPAAWADLETALRQRRPVRVSYHDKQRLICPHALGWRNGRPMLLGYQTGGHTTTGTLPANPRQRWRNFFVDEIDHVVPAGSASPWQSADNYNHRHPFNSIDELTIAITPPGIYTPVR